MTNWVTEEKEGLKKSTFVQFFSDSESHLSPFISLTYTRDSSFILLNILKVFTNGFPHVSFKA